MARAPAATLTFRTQIALPYSAQYTRWAFRRPHVSSRQWLEKCSQQKRENVSCALPADDDVEASAIEVVVMFAFVIVIGAELNAEIEHAAPWGPGRRRDVTIRERPKVGLAASRDYTRSRPPHGVPATH